MLRDVFYYGQKPNAHPRERYAVNLADARNQSTTEHFWIINEHCDYTNFDWDFDFDFLPDEDVWAQEHINVWPSHYQKDSGTWLCSENDSDVIIYRADVDPIKLKDTISSNWQIIENIDKSKFDFKWHPDPTDPPYIYVFGNQWYPGTTMPTVLYTVEGATEQKHVTTQLAYLLPMPELFVTIHETIDFDYSWRSDPTSPPYIYVFGNSQYPANIMPTIEFHVEGATERKYIENIVPKLKPQQDKFNILEIIDRDKFDFSWVPDPTSPPYIYVFGNNQYPGTIMPTVEYTVEGATERKYIDDIVAQLLPMQSVFNTIHETLDFDYSWRPDPTSPPYIYVFGNTQYPGTVMPTIEYVVAGATERKYIDDIIPKLAHQPHKFDILENIDTSTFDFSWVPDPSSPPYIYAWGNQWNKPEDKISVRYIVEGATEYKYMEVHTTRKQCTDNWETPGYVIQSSFDYSWEPNPNDPPYIYQFGTIHQKTGGPRYIVKGATEVKYINSIKAKVVPWQFKNWQVPRNIDQKSFDFSWHPDSTEPNYIYQFPSQWSRSGGPKFTTPNATEIKYVDFPIATAKADMTHWSIPEGLDTSTFDFSWHPDIEDKPYIYVFGTQHQKTGGPVFTAPLSDENTPIKYIDVTKAIKLPNTEYWVTHIDVEDFDFSWHPDDTEQPYIYQWGNKHYSSELKPTIEYIVPSATEIKHMSQDVKLKPSDNWIEHCSIDKNKFDFTWRPNPTSPPYIYVWGNKHVSGTLAPTIEYTVESATEIKYMTDDVVILPELDKWNIIQKVNLKSFDLTWRPNPTSPPYIYAWSTPSKWENNAITVAIEYIVPGAIEYNYIDEPVEVIESTVLNEELEIDIDMSTISDNYKLYTRIKNFDFTWKPDPREPSYIYTWGNKYIEAELKPTLEYVVQGATERKYMGNVEVYPEWDKWKLLIPVDKSSFDFSWRPDPREPAYIYVWGNKYNEAEREPTIEYHCDGATERKFMTDNTVKTLPEMDRWKTLIPVSEFDYSWRPDPTSPPYIYIFGNKWNDGTTEPTVEYHVPGAHEYKYITDVVAVPEVDLKYWSISNTDDLETFDFSWRPNPHSPPQIYQWQDNGPRYIVPNATEVVLVERTEGTKVNVVNRYKIKTTLEELINEHPNEVFWAINPDLSYDKFDFSWRPTEENFRHINVFGNQYSKNTQTYYVNAPLYLLGHKEFNYVEDQTVEIDTNLSMFFVDKGNGESQQRFEQLKQRYPNIQKTRYLNSWVDTINRCINKSQTKLCWILNSELDYSEFVFDYYPSPWQEKMVHVFGTQWSHWGTTFMVNKESFPEDTKYVKIIEHLNVLNFVKSKRTIAKNCLYPVYLIDHGNIDIDNIQGITITKVNYNQSYLRTFKDILELVPKKNENYIWVVSSICDYSNFDFSYICDPYAKDQLHVFPSDRQKFGDTFLIDVNKLQTLIDDMMVLEDYNKINFNQHLRTKRLDPPVVITNDDTHCSSINTDYNFPYMVFTTYDNIDIKAVDTEPMNLWAPNTKNIIVTSTGGTRIVVPKEAKEYIKNELYDYPYITKINKPFMSNPLDIVFLSNGETGADENYEHLLKVTKGLRNRVVRVDGVNGRVAAYHAAAEASNTPWMFTVFAKLRVDSKFDWNWQPDRLQVPKHYIFNATNPVNGLVYGHQAMIAYNKRITLNNMGKGLDFTLDNDHEVVELNSGVARYNTDEFSTWRTSFRECIKLRLEDSPISRHRLKVWSTVGQGDFAQYSIQGAQHAVEYFESVNGDIEKLRLSYDWPWLKEYFNNKYKL